MTISSCRLLVIAWVLSASLIVASSTDDETLCPLPPDTSTGCQSVNYWTDLIAAVSANYNGRVVLCSFNLTPTRAFVVREPVDVLCEDGGLCEIVGGSTYQVEIRSDHVRWMGFTFLEANTSAIASWKNHTAICNCRFESNERRESEGGAAIIQMSGGLSAINSSFTGNVAKNGGAIYNKNGTLIVLDSTFIGNEAMYGGAIKASGGGSLKVAGSTFTSNISSRTGPAIAFNSNGSMTDGDGNSGSDNVSTLNYEECNGIYNSGACSDFIGRKEDTLLTPAVSMFDDHGSLMAYQSCTSCISTQDWVSRWDTYGMTLDSAFETDPYDPRATMRGSGTITTDPSTGVAVFSKNPRFYINQETGWENVEFTTYGMYVSDPYTRQYAGLTLAARSNHDEYRDDGCKSPTYYARIYRDTGNVGFLKEYYHDGSGELVYAKSNKVPFFEDGLPFHVWIGMKFVVVTVPGTSNVLLQLYIDLSDGENGGEWHVVHEYLDTPGSWVANEPVPSQCTDVTNGDTILGPRQHCFFRVSGYDFDTEVHFKKGTIRNIDPVPL